MSCYKYLGIGLMTNCPLQLILKKKKKKKLKALLGFYYRHKSCLSPAEKKRVVQTTFVPVLDYGDIVYKSSFFSPSLSGHNLSQYLTNITNSAFRTHHCDLCSRGLL